jgi:hypothetical protein
MNKATNAKRIGLAMIDAATRDFLSGGYMNMLDEEPSRLFQLNPHTNLIFAKVRDKGADVIILRIEKKPSGKWEEVHHTLRRGDVGVTTVETATSKPWGKNYLWIASELAMALTQVMSDYTVNGERRELNQGGNGFSAIASEDVAEAFTSMQNKSVRSAAA